MKAQIHSGVGSDAVKSSGGDVRLRQLRDRHRFILGLAVFVVAAAFCFQSNQDTTLHLPWSNTELPTMCASRLLFGAECPGCGLTRSFVALAAGDFRESVRYNRVGWLVALAVVIQIPYRLFALRELHPRIVPRPWLAWFGYGLIAALIVNWLLKILGI